MININSRALKHLCIPVRPLCLGFCHESELQLLLQH